MRVSFFSGLCVALSCYYIICFASATVGAEGRKQIELKGNAASVSFDIAGGALVDFHLNGMNLNPFTWNHPDMGDTDPRPMGHFICFDRWGQPSANELKNGMPYHGEATSVVWKTIAQPRKQGNSIVAEMLCELPMGGMTLKRTVSLSSDEAVLQVQEVITNRNKLGRVYNIVQHPSIAAPFLDETVVIDSNAWKGYLQESPWPNPEEPVIYWPHITYKGALVDLRLLAGDHNPGVTSFVFKEGIEYGWVTAANPAGTLLVGYIWNLSEYPWLNFWRNSQNGKPAARGLEFGTTGLHRPFKDMLEKRTIFDTSLCEYIDAGEEIVKTYIAFLAEIPNDYRGVESIDYSEGTIVLRERGGDGSKTRTINIKY